MKNKAKIWVIILCMFFIPIISYGEQTEETKEAFNTQQIIEEQIKLFDWDSINQLEASLKQSAPYTSSFDLGEEVTKILTGEQTLSVEYILSLIGEMMLVEARSYITLIARFILIVLLCSLLQTLTSAFKSKDITKIAFIVCYLLIIYTISQSLFVIVDVASNTIEQLSQVMLVTLPTLLGFMAVSGYISSSSALATVIIGGLNGVTFLIQHIALPMVVGLIMLQVISTMSEDIKIDKFVKLIYRGIGISLKTIVAVSITLMGVYKLTLPYVDVAVKKSALNFSSAFIPVVGDASRGALEFILSCSHLVKNSFAVGVILWVVVVASVPLIKIFVYVALYHLAGAIIQPTGNKKMSDIASILGKGCEFILSCTGIIFLLAVVSLVICASVGSSIA